MTAASVGSPVFLEIQFDKAFSREPLSFQTSKYPVFRFTVFSFRTAFPNLISSQNPLQLEMSRKRERPSFFTDVLLFFLPFSLSLYLSNQCENMFCSRRRKAQSNQSINHMNLSLQLLSQLSSFVSFFSFEFSKRFIDFKSSRGSLSS